MSDYLSLAIEKLGTAAAVSRSLGVTQATIHRWKREDRVPDKYLEQLKSLQQEEKPKRGRPKTILKEEEGDLTELSFKEPLISTLQGFDKPRYLGEVTVDDKGKSTGAYKHMVALTTSEGSEPTLVFEKLDQYGFGLLRGERVRFVANPEVPKPVTQAFSVVPVEELLKRFEQTVERAVAAAFDAKISELRKAAGTIVNRRTETSPSPSLAFPGTGRPGAEVPQLEECPEEEYRAKEARHQDIIRKVGDDTANHTIKELLGLSAVTGVTLGGWNSNTKPTHVHPAGCVRISERKTRSLTGQLYTSSGAIGITVLVGEGQVDGVEKYLSIFG